MMRLSTARLLLRRFSHSDWTDLYDYLSRPEVVKYEPYNVFDKEACKQEAVRRAQNPDFLAVCLKATGRLIGNLYFHRCENQAINTWQIGYVFNPDFHGNGYATESCKAIMDYAFERLEAHRITAKCHTENKASWELMERLGMRMEGLLRQNIFFYRDKDGDPVWLDTYEYAMLADDWQAQYGNSTHYHIP